jgi:L-ascorbate metabolism protein UlaG (beta-lactamase superfamily)
MTASKKVSLKPNVLAEPLFNRWYAWSYLIPPATAAMYVANLHLKIMQSFVAAPQTHVAALRNPAMIGGPFINHAPDRVEDVKALMERTVRNQSRLLALADAIRTLDKTLSDEADGSSIESLYQKTPDALKGYVELVYDLNHHPSIRFIEGLLYKSPYFDESAQSLAFSLVETDDRPFVFSTPRLRGDAKLELRIPFRDRSLDRLFEMKSVPGSLGQIMEMLNLSGEDEELFSRFFTESEPRWEDRYSGDDVRIRYFGHACLLIESRESSILCDPVISYEYPTDAPRFTYADLPERIDYALITHGHQDHLLLETLLQLRHKVKTVLVPKNNGGGLADPSLKLVLQNVGFSDVREIDEAETVEIEGGAITGLPFFGEHGDLNIRSKIAYLINLRGRSVICAADSNNLEPLLYERVREVVKKVDAMFIGMECDGAPLSWLYGPLFTKPLLRKVDQSRRSNGSDYGKAMDIVERVGPGAVYVYAMGQEPWLTYLTSVNYTEESRPIVDSNKLVADCRRRGLKAERLYGQKEIWLR